MKPWRWFTYIALALALSACVPVATPSTGWMGSGGSADLQDTAYWEDLPEVDSSGEAGYVPPPPGTGGSDGGYIAPESLLFCGETGTIVLQKGQNALLSWSYPQGATPQTELQLSLETTPAGIQNRGTLVHESVLTARYHAPTHIPQAFTVDVRATLGDSSTPAVCRIRLMEEGELGVEDDGLTRGPVGNVYVLEANTPKLPDFSQMEPVSEIVMPNFDVPEREFSLGFPGVADLFEWFGIRFEGRFVAPESGLYRFRLTSDDGSILWINGAKVVDNDGVHAPRTIDGSVHLEAGIHPFRLDYFQGPRYRIALQLFWRPPGVSAYAIVPPDNIMRP